MKIWLARMPITRKLFAINLLVILAASLVTASVLILAERTTLRERIVNELVAQAEIVAYNSAVSLAFDEPASARDVLSAFRAVPQVQEAIVFDIDFEVFARYSSGEKTTYQGGYTEIAGGRVQWPTRSGHDVVFADDGIFIFTPVMLAGERVGSLFIRSSVEQFNTYTRQTILIGVVALLIAVLVAMLFLAPMVKLVSDPVVELLHTVNAVRRDKDYDLRALRMANDEFGDLADAFNAMLEEIGHRDSELSRHQLRLESEVQERTQALKKANRHLEETVFALQQANRAIRISEENKRVAEASADAKAQFLANMSHELRTPMNGVLGMLSLLAETQLSDDQRHYVDVAYESGNILLELLNNVLDLSKIEQGKLMLENIAFNLREAIDEVVSIVGESAYTKGLELVVLKDHDAPIRVVGDPVRFKQLIFNLVGNAIKFTHTGMVSICYSAQQSEPGRVRLRFEVQDTGVGIGDEVKERIFDSFTQADSSTTRKYGGSGLGLALCRQIIRLMEGEIGVESRQGVGSTFWFEAWFGQPAAAHAVETPRVGSGLVHVLVLDPSGISADGMGHYLAELGIQGDIVADEVELLAQLDREHPDYGKLLVSLEPGNEAIGELLHNADLLRHFPLHDIVFYGSITQRNHFKSMPDYAVFNVLIKPVRLEQLRHALDESLVLPASAATIRLAQQRRILVVEDNRINQQVAVGLLEKLGYQTAVADNGAEALQLLENQRFDLVLMDCQMPVLDGYSATRTLREWESEGRPKTPVVAMTAHAMAGDRDLCIQAGMNDYIAKPVRAVVLRRVLDLWLSDNEEGQTYE